MPRARKRCDRQRRIHLSGIQLSYSNLLAFCERKRDIARIERYFLPQDEALDDGYYDYEEQSTQKEITATSSIFDVVMHDFDKHFENATVQGFDISPLGDLRIDFTNGVYFETFTPSARKCEEWRFLPPGEEDHFVVFDV